jgi:hypothetical protein
MRDILVFMSCVMSLSGAATTAILLFHEYRRCRTLQRTQALQNTLDWPKQPASSREVPSSGLSARIDKLTEQHVHALEIRQEAIQ